MSQPALAVEPPDTAETRVDALMTRNVTTLDRNDTMDIAADVMAAGRLRHLPIMDGGRVVGVVSERDLFRPGLAGALGYGSKARRMLLRCLPVVDAGVLVGLVTETDLLRHAYGP